MVKVAWFVVILAIILKLMRMKIRFIETDVNKRTTQSLIIEVLIVLWFTFCAIIVTLDIVKWIYPILH